MKADIETEYRRRYSCVLEPLARDICSHIQEHLDGQPRIDRVTARAKSVNRFVAKAMAIKDGKPKYSEPLRQIQDQIGARIITFYLQDVVRVSEIIEKYYRPVESKKIVPETVWEFGYFGTHYILLTPTELIQDSIDKALVPDFFELQIKTLFQHAWSEAEHDVGYKPELGKLTEDEVRQLAFTSAQAWGADRIFSEMYERHSSHNLEDIVGSGTKA